MGAMHVDLVGATGVEPEAQKGEVGETFHHLPVGAGVAAGVVVDDGILLAIGRMAADGGDDRALPDRRQAGRGPPPGTGGRRFASGSVFAGAPEPPGSWPQRCNRGVLIEAVHDARPHLAANAGEG